MTPCPSSSARGGRGRRRRRSRPAAAASTRVSTRCPVVRITAGGTRGRASRASSCGRRPACRPASPRKRGSARGSTAGTLVALGRVRGIIASRRTRCSSTSGRSPFRREPTDAVLQPRTTRTPWRRHRARSASVAASPAIAPAAGVGPKRASSPAWTRLEAEDGPLFVVVGVFDGLHRGHAYLSTSCAHEAAKRRARAGGHHVRRAPGRDPAR